MALRLHAITLAEAGHAEQPTGGDGRPTGAFAAVRDDIQFISFRDLSAVVSDQKGFTLDEVTPEEIERHRAIVDGIFRRRWARCFGRMTFSHAGWSCITCR